MATSAAIAPLPAMPMSIDFVFQRATMIAPRTPAEAAICVTSRISGKRPSSAPSVEPGLNPNQPSHRISTPSPNSGMLCPGIARGLPSLPYLPRLGPSMQQHRERAGGADQVDRGRAGEVLHAEVGLQPAAAEHPVRADRVDEPGEDDRVDDVDAELDPLERRAPHDGERDGAEDELEEPLRLDRRVGETHDGERLQRIAVVAQEEAVMADDVADAEGEGEADRPVHERRDREVREDLRDHGARVLPTREPDLEERKTGLHEHHETAGDDHPQGVDRHGLGEDAVLGGVQGVGGCHRRYCQGTPASPSRDPRASHERRKTTTSSVVRERG